MGGVLFNNIFRTVHWGMINFSDSVALPPPPETSTLKKDPPSSIQKYRSEPKFTSLKEEILRIPKVKQILQKDRLVYSQDIEKRVELLGTLKN